MQNTGLDYVYILGDGSKFSNLELRLSLRSLEKYGNGNRVVVCGSDPGFLSNEVLFIPNKPLIKKGDKENAIMQQFKRVAEDDRVSDDFIQLNDDYIFLGKVNHGYFHKGLLRDEMEKFTGSPYGQHLLATEVALTGKGYETFNFDVHYPMVYNKAKLVDVITSYDWNVPMGFCLKSLYCNTLGIEGEVMLDYKVRRKEEWENWPMVSLPDTINRKMLKKLLTLFPNKSIYEV